MIAPFDERETIDKGFEMHYYPHHIGDFIKDTSRLSDSQCMAYLRLIWMYYESESPLPDDPKMLAFKIGSDEQTVAMLLQCYFYANALHWHHKRIDAMLQEYKNKSKKASDSAKARWNNGNGMRTHSDGSAKPITNNQNKEENTYVGNGIPDCPHATLIQLYAECLPNLTQPRVWEGTRASNMKARWRFILTNKNHKGEPYATDEESAIAFFRKFFNYVSKCDFLVGKTSEWQCDLPWLMKAENFNKVIEGKYQNKEAA